MNINFYVSDCRLIVFAFLSYLPLCQAVSKSSENKVSGQWDFSDGKVPKEWAIKNDNWEVRDGKIVNNDKFYHTGMFVSKLGPVSDFVIEADIKINKEHMQSGSSWAGFHLRADMPSHETPFNNGYLVIIRRRGDATILCMNKEEKSVRAFSTLLKNKFNKLRVEMTGPLMQVFANGKKVAEYKDEKFKSGYVSLINFGNETFYDNIKFEGVKVPAISNSSKVSPLIPKKMPPVKPLPRIIAKKGKGKPGYFVNEKTGKVFVPDGYNHIVGDEAKLPHANFNIDTYNSKKTDKALGEMKASGANTVRFWLWGTDRNGYGIWGGPYSKSLNKEYMENFCDFLRLATKHGIYTVPTLELIPANAKYRGITLNGVKNADRKVTDHNSDVLLQGFIDARKQAVRDTIRFVRESDPNLLNAVLGWSLANEIHMVSVNGPFNLTHGIVKVANGKSYDMADFNSRQKCADESYLYWANQLADVVHAEDPKGLVTLGMWTSDAHGRPPVNGLLDPDDIDPRFPPRPSVFASPECKIDFLDIHVYLWGDVLYLNREAHELDALSSYGIPVIVGEYGVFAHQAKDYKEGAEKILELRKSCYDAGYAGALHWSWDYDNGLFIAVKEVREALSEARKKAELLREDQLD